MKNFYIIILSFIVASPLIVHSQNIGIGVPSPQEKLHIDGFLRGNQSGAVRISTGHGYVDLGPKNTSWSHFETDRSRYYFNKGITVDEGLIGSYSQNLQLQTNGTTRITALNSNGNVGIGTSSPSEKLDVNGNAVFRGSITAENNKSILYPKGGYLYDATSSHSKFIVIWLPDNASINTMLNIRARLYKYTTQQSAEFSISGYTYPPAPSRWINTSFLSEGNTDINTAEFIVSNAGRYGIVLTNNGAKIGLSYSHFVIENVDIGYGVNYLDDLEEGWEVQFADAYPAFQNKITTTSSLRLAGDLRVGGLGSGVLSSDANGNITSGNISWGNISGVPDDKWNGLDNITGAIDRTGNVSLGDLTVSGDDITTPGSMRLISSSGYIDFRSNNSQHGLILRDHDGSSTSWGGIRVVDSDRMEFQMDDGSYGNSLVIKDNDNVGVGTTNPVTKFEIEGAAQNWNETTPGTSVGSFHLDPGVGTDNFGNAITFGASDASNGDNAQAGIYVRSDGSYGTKMYLSTTDSYAAGAKARMMIDNDGKIGIGTTGPGYELDVVGSVRARSRIYIGTNGGNFYNDSGSRIKTDQDFYTNNSNTYLYSDNLYLGDGSGDNVQLRGNQFTWTSGSGGIINTAGKVGIGTTSISSDVILEVNGGVGVSRMGIGGTYNSNQVQGIWTIAPNYKIDVAANDFGSQYGMVYAHTNAGTSGSKKPISGWGHQIMLTSNGTRNIAMSMTNGNAYFAGNVSIGSTSSGSYDLYVNGKIGSNGINETSDRRFKKDIQPLESCLDKVMQLQGVSYYWKVEDFPDRKFEQGKDIGVIAQEVEKIFPEVVDTDNEGYKSVQYSHLVPVLIEALKEQQVLLENKENRINELEAKVSKHEAVLQNIDLEKLLKDYTNNSELKAEKK